MALNVTELHYRIDEWCSLQAGQQHTTILHDLQGSAKAQKMVAIIKSHQFMERYKAEISARDERIKESKRLG